MDIAYIHGGVHAVGGYLPMRWVEYDHKDVPISIGVADPWVQCNIDCRHQSHWPPVLVSWLRKTFRNSDCQQACKVADGRIRDGDAVGSNFATMVELG